MRALIQRVKKAAVSVDQRVVGHIDKGLLIFLGVRCDDTDQDLHFVSDKCLNLRIFEDQQGKMNRSLLDISGSALIVSQFTLYGDTRKGRRPSFTRAAPPAQAEQLYEQFVTTFRNRGIHTQTGIFGAYMQVEIQNDGPVTLMVESESKRVDSGPSSGKTHRFT